MFKNFQEHFERSEESRFGSDFLGFNPKLERLKLILAAVLIPVGCSFFYFLQTGHKYADIDSAIGNIESPAIDINQELDRLANTSDLIDDSYSSSQSNRSIVFDDETDDQSDSSEHFLPTMGIMSDLERAIDDPLTDESHAALSENTKTSSASIQAAPISGRHLNELTGFLIADDGQKIKDANVHLNAGRSQSELAYLIIGNDQVTDKGISITNENTHSDRLNTVEQSSDDKIDQDIAFIAASQFTDIPALEHDRDDLNIEHGQASAAKTRPVNAISSANRLSMQSTAPDVVIAAEKDNIKSENALNEQESKIILVDKIIGLLKSEVITTQSTADTGKRRITNRHTHPIKKSFDVNKLESMLEDI